MKKTTPQTSPVRHTADVVLHFVPDDAGNDAPGPCEPYRCTGDFEADFTGKCREADMLIIPPVVPRPRTPSVQSVPEDPYKSIFKQELGLEKGQPRKKGCRKMTMNMGLASVRPSEDTEPVVPVLSPWPCEQRTAFLVKDKFEYFKPCVQVEKEQPEQPTSGVTAVYIRGWKVDMRIMEILRSCFIHLEKLHTINMWNVGLTSESVNFLTCMLPLCPNLKSIVLDANPVDKQNYSQLIQGGTVQHLSLRHCRITDEGACRLGHEVGSLKSTNTSLLSLDLAGNLITDEGAAHLSKALRTNRTLLTLSLANNKIGDRGATMLAEVLARFPLTHEECLERRYRIAVRDARERASRFALRLAKRRTLVGQEFTLQVPERKTRPSRSLPKLTDLPEAVTPSGRQKKPGRRARANSSEIEITPRSRRISRRTREMSPEDDEEASPRDRKGKKKQDRMDADKAWEEMAEIEEDDSEIEPGGRPGKEDAGGKDGKEEKGGKAGGGKTKGKRTPRGRKGKTAAESSSDTKTDGTAADGKSNLAQTGSQRLPALLEEVVCVNGIPYMLGNYVIISLNLSRNKIGEAGLRSLLSAVQYQSALAREEIDPDTGLLRLCLHKNRVQADNSVLRKIEGVMRSRSVLKGEFESPIAHS